MPTPLSEQAKSLRELLAKEPGQTASYYAAATGLAESTVYAQKAYIERQRTANAKAGFSLSAGNQFGRCQSELAMALALIEKQPGKSVAYYADTLLMTPEELIERLSKPLMKRIIRIEEWKNELRRIKAYSRLVGMNKGKEER